MCELISSQSKRLNTLDEKNENSPFHPLFFFREAGIWVDLSWVPKMEVEAVAAAATEQAVIAKNAVKVAATAAAERADIETNAVSAAAASEVEQASIKKTVEEDERDSKRKRKRNATPRP